jgi:hypothetical protein
MMHPDQLHQLVDLQRGETVADASRRRRARVVRAARRAQRQGQDRRELRDAARRPPRGPRRDPRGLA